MVNYLQALVYPAQALFFNNMYTIQHYIKYDVIQYLNFDEVTRLQGQS